MNLQINSCGNVSISNGTGRQIDDFRVFKLPVDRTSTGADIEIKNGKFEVAASIKKGIERGVCQDSVGIMIGQGFIAIVMSDGFGPKGHIYSEAFVEQTFAEIEMKKRRIARRVRNGTIKIDGLTRKIAKKTRLKLISNDNSDESGATAVLALITNDTTQAACVGDSALYTSKSRFYSRHFDYNRIVVGGDRTIRPPHLSLGEILKHGNILDSYISEDGATLREVETTRLEGKTNILIVCDGITKNLHRMIKEKPEKKMFETDEYENIRVLDTSGEADLNGILYFVNSAIEITKTLTDETMRRNKENEISWQEAGGNNYICIPTDDDISAVKFRWRDERYASSSKPHIS